MEKKDDFQLLDLAWLEKDEIVI